MSGSRFGMVDLAVQGLGAGELIGGGASSSVFAATRLAFGDRVAVKVLKQTLTDEQSRSHFEREARALTELADIPGVVAVLDSGVNARGEPYLVLPLFENSAQGDVTTNGPMTPARAARIVASAARSVHQGHLRGVIHRDLKPANLLLTQSDDIFVSDFGIAKLTDSSVSASGWLGLTPAYAPPEALEGLPAGVLGDVYSLGATLAALVIGTPPFSSTGSESPIALLNRVVNQPAPDLATFGAPPAVATAVARAMAKDPTQRYSSALELAVALEESGPSTLGRATIDTSTTIHTSTTIDTSTISAAVEPPAPPAAESLAFPSPPEPIAAQPPPVAQPSPTPPPAAMPASPHTRSTPVPSAPAATPPVPPLSPTPTPTPTPTPVTQAGGDGNKVALGVGVAVLVAAIVGGVIAFGLSGDDVASTPAPTAVVVAPATSEPEPTAVAGSTDPPAPEPATAAPTTIPTPAFPAAVAGGPVDVYPDGSGEVANLTAAVARALDGDVIRLAAGTYEIGAVIRVRSDVTIIGAGIDETILVGTSDAGVLQFASVGGRLRNLTVTSSLTPTDENVGLIEAFESPQLMIDSVKTLGSPGFGLAIIGSTVNVTNSAFVGSRLSGVGIDAGSTAQIVSSASSNNGDNGFFVFDDSTAVFLNNESRDNGSAGFRAEGSGSPEFVSNIAANNGISGFLFTSATTPTLEGNTSVGNGEAGFGWFGTSAGTAVANTAHRNAHAGFSANEDSAPGLTANRSHDNLESGFLWTAQAAGTAIGNRADDNGLNGYALIESARPSLRGNVASSNAEADFFNDVTTGDLVIDEAGIIRVEVDDSGDTSDLEAAIAQASNGDVIRLGPGMHRLPGTISVTKDLTIVGSGTDTTTIDVSTRNAAFQFESTPVRLLDLTLTTSFETDDDAERFSVVEIDSSSDFTVDNVVITGSVGIGLGIFGSTGTVSNSQVTDSFWSGIGVSASSQVTISDVAVANNGQSGVVFFEDAGGRVVGSVADGNRFFGFSVQGAGSPEIFSNVSSNNDASGFGIAETASPTLIGNVARGNGEAGFRWFDTTSGDAIANTAMGNSNSGFNISNAASPSLTSNDSNRNDVDGFTWFATSSGIAVGNIATGNVFDGFAAEEESSPTLERNASTENERFDFNQSGDATPTLTDNEFG